MGSVPTGRKVIFTQPLPPSSQDEDGDDAYALDPLLALDQADTIAAGNGQGSTLKPDQRDGERATKKSPLRRSCSTAWTD